MPESPKRLEEIERNPVRPDTLKGRSLGRGAWLPPVKGFSCRLHAARHFEDACRIDLALQALPAEPSPADEVAVLGSVFDLLAGLRNRPLKGQTPEETQELGEALRQVTQLVKDWMRHKADEQRARERAAEAIKPLLAALPAPGAGGLFGELLTFAAESLKGDQRKVVEAICDRAGSCPLADLAMKLNWNLDEAGPKFNDAKKAIQPKLTSAGLHWRLKRHDNCAVAFRLPK